jgi:hypothetical protein
MASAAVSVSRLLQHQDQSSSDSSDPLSPFLVVRPVGFPLRTCSALYFAVDLFVEQGSSRRSRQLLAAGRRSVLRKPKRERSWGILVGAAFLVVPGLEPVLVAGPLVAAIIGGMESAIVVGGLSAIGAGLLSIGFQRTAF